MLALATPARFWLYTPPTDMRKSYNGLSALVKHHLHADPSDGNGYIFLNRTRTLMKCLYYQAGGLCLFCKRLEQGQFASLEHRGQQVSLTMTEFAGLIEGLDIEIKKQRKRHKKSVQNE